MLDKSMRLNKTNTAQNLLYKLDSMRRKAADTAKKEEEEKSNPATKSTQSTEKEKPKYTPQ